MCWVNYYYWNMMCLVIETNYFYERNCIGVSRVNYDLLIDYKIASRFIINVRNLNTNWTRGALCQFAYKDERALEMYLGIRFQSISSVLRRYCNWKMWKVLPGTQVRLVEQSATLRLQLCLCLGGRNKL